MMGKVVFAFFTSALVACSSAGPSEPDSARPQRGRAPTKELVDTELEEEIVEGEAAPRPEERDELSRDLPPPPPSTTPSPLATNVSKAIAYGRSIIGTKYGTWTGGDLPLGAPLWTASGAPPSSAQVKAESAASAGVANLVLRSIGKTPPTDSVQGNGGTGAYAAFYANVAKPFEPGKTYPDGTLLGRKYRDVSDQGRIGIAVDGGKVLTSTPDNGVAIGAVNATAWEYVVAPAQWLAP